MPATNSTSRSRTRDFPAEAGAKTSGTALVRLPFNSIEECWQLRQPPDETANIQLEVRVSGALDERALRAALRGAVSLHPLARARRVEKRRRLRPPQWEIGDPDGHDLLRVVDCREESDRDATRVGFYNQVIALDRAPALRVLLAHQPGGDSLLLNVHHAIADGIGTLRFLHSVARAYDGRPDPVPPIDPLAVRDFRSFFGQHAAEPPPRVELPKVPDGRRAFIAPEGPRLEDGYGFRQLALSAERTRRLDPRRYGPGATLNDLLQGALHRTIAAWNRRRARPCDGIAVYMPSNFRPREWRLEVVANLASGGKVASTPAVRRTNESLMRAVMGQTRRIKAGGAAAAALALPRWVVDHSAVMLPWISAVLGDRVENTAVLSNLGRIDDVPDFGKAAGAVTECWFSPPCGMPMGLALGVTGMLDRLHLVFRYRRALLDDTAAGAFSDLFLDCLTELAEGPRDDLSARPEPGPVPTTGRLDSKGEATR